MGGRVAVAVTASSPRPLVVRILQPLVVGLVVGRSVVGGGSVVGVVAAWLGSVVVVGRVWLSGAQLSPMQMELGGEGVM